MIFLSIPITSLILEKKKNFFIVRLRPTTVIKTQICQSKTQESLERWLLQIETLKVWQFDFPHISGIRHLPQLSQAMYVKNIYTSSSLLQKKVYIDAPCKIESPVAYFLFSQQPLGGWPRFSIPHTSFADYSILGSFISSIKILSLF